MQRHVIRPISPVNDARLVHPVSKVPMVCRVFKDLLVNREVMVEVEASVSQDRRDRRVIQDNRDSQDHRANPVNQALMAPVVVALPVHEVTTAVLATLAATVSRVHEATTVSQVRLDLLALLANLADMVNLAPMDHRVVPAFPATMQPIARAHRDRPCSFRDSASSRWFYRSITTIRDSANTSTLYRSITTIIPQLFFRSNREPRRKPKRITRSRA
jgi:hypothetical protein